MRTSWYRARAATLDNSKRAFLLSGGDQPLKATGSITNAGIVYGLDAAPATVTVQTDGAFTNAATGTVMAGTLLNVKAASYTNTAPASSGGVGSLGRAKLNISSGWDPIANGLISNGLLMLDTADITIGVGKTWEANNVQWSGTLTNLGTVVLNQGAGTVVNQSTGTATFGGLPNQGDKAGSYEFDTPSGAGLSSLTWLGYTDVANRAKFSAGAFSGSVTNIAGDVSGSMTINYNAVKLAQTAIWAGVPDTDPTGTAVQILSGAASLPRANFTGTGTVHLTSPTAGTIVGNNVTITAADLTVDRSHTIPAQTGIGLAHNLALGSVMVLPAGTSA